MDGRSPTPDVLKAGKTMIGVKFRKMRLNVQLDTKFHSRNARNFETMKPEDCVDLIVPWNSPNSSE